MGKVGIFGSSFDPITDSHLFLAKTLADLCNFEYVIFVPCVSSRGDGKKMKASDEDRWNMIQLAIKDNPIFKADDFEMNAKAGIGKQYTYHTMEYFKEKYPDDEHYFIMGADILAEIDNQSVQPHQRWKFREELIKNNKFVVMSRDNIDMLKEISKSPILRKYHDGTRFHLVDKGISMEISSSYIRDEISMGRYPQYLMRDDVYDYIVTNEIYKHTTN
ncbi:nicotinate (nicotinamide) nucleotide adenylyltransferase [Alkalicoccobacillus plakortidis]|uniref:Probable nicotinate-nucleotide adenylyltransferase n=1 Tax=Alkalicoccobacillus plakortidis TaxID=444060 RepID=A0ABT0XI96_9BACI|nr:nicotinate (nicotinamide) nucleotide adenylyltransferase [Alkalicoccobacillus plakortidis]MCM2674924.1 nicotinate (nicotinamide) nucleotide adenylyltransferase [Alkalicoccobacillus plakortidis]